MPGAELALPAPTPADLVQVKSKSCVMSRASSRLPWRKAQLLPPRRVFWPATLPRMLKLLVLYCAACGLKARLRCAMKLSPVWTSYSLVRISSGGNCCKKLFYSIKKLNQRFIADIFRTHPYPYGSEEEHTCTLPLPLPVRLQLSGKVFTARSTRAGTGRRSGCL